VERVVVQIDAADGQLRREADGVDYENRGQQAQRRAAWDVHAIALRV
jgi:hypothetical protein